MSEYGLGRIPSKPHPRMAAFPAEALLPPDARPRSYTWSCGLWLNQHDTPRCVGYSSVHEAAARPVVRTDVNAATADRVYEYAQDHDYWPGTNYAGTSVDGGMQALREFGFIESWWWARNLETALLGVALKGPGVAGLDWWTGMFRVSSDGWITPTGAIEGGHAILLPQVRLGFKAGATLAQRTQPGWTAYLHNDRSWVGFHNSWGKDWQGGKPARMHIPDFAALLQAGGELAIPIGRKKAA